MAQAYFVALNAFDAVCKAQDNKLTFYCKDAAFKRSIGLDQSLGHGLSMTWCCRVCLSFTASVNRQELQLIIFVQNLQYHIQLIKDKQLIV